MDILQFRTNIANPLCVNTASLEIDKLSNVKNWEVNTKDSQKVLTIRGSQLNPTQIKKAIKKAGFKAEAIN